MQIPPPITHLLPLLLLHASPTLSSSSSSSNNGDAILLSKVQSLTLKGHGAQTRHRRVPAIPQLRCVNAQPELRRLAESGVDVMRCLNEGKPSYGGTEDVTWSCAAVLAPEIALAETDVVCEGYAHPDDDEVLRGSCGVEYTVRLTPLGEERYPHLVAGGYSHGYGAPRHDDEDGWDWAAVAFALVFLAVLGTIVYGAYAAWTGNQRQPPRRRTAPRNNNDNNRGGRAPGPGWDPNFGGGWNDDNDDNDPPPPYPGTGGSYSGGRAKRSSAGSRSSSSRGNSNNDNAAWRPGFWSGLGTGGLAGYAAGRRAGAQGREDAAAAGPSRQQARGSGEPAISRPVGSWSRSSGGSDFGSSSTPHTSTGMGGTRRR
ncbi:hypothetical protein N3K66_002717 [Trichothecium roseum]|uniref:Uncharacterized protein n=1 Tax=Trichothecium roseum TaxID=47278 RepID=A0ACC0VCC8_9HYPO|nr:hypothetical protein N3K66_002717 [Trichothecium roseum]